jgi:hypothetical protein
MPVFRKEFEESCRKQFESDSKIGLLCSVAPDGYPHIALITSLSVKDRKTIMWGQFSQGLSKTYLKDNPKTGFLVVSPDQRWWSGKALHTGTVVKGEDFEFFNNKPLFRYNSYCGFGAVHYGKLVDVSVGEPLPLLKIALGFLHSGALRSGALGSGGVKKLLASHTEDNAIQKMPPYGLELASGLACLKFAAFVDTDGFPRLFPVMQGRPAGHNALVFSPSPYTDLLVQIPAEVKSAVFLANLSLESLLLQGCWFNTEKGGRLKGAVFEIDRVYNSMLPVSGYIYPPPMLPNVFGNV